MSAVSRGFRIPALTPATTSRISPRLQSRIRHPSRLSRPSSLLNMLLLFILLFLGISKVEAGRYPLKPLRLRRDDVPVINSTDLRTFHITNGCSDTIHPAFSTQAGTGPEVNGFELAPGSKKILQVSADWAGRIWGRTNCSFNEDGSAPSAQGGIDGTGAACLTGDCGGTMECELAGKPPTTLAEFAMSAPDGHTYYDISLVDGYSIPIAIISMSTANNGSFIALNTTASNATNPSSNSSILVPVGSSNPVCIATSDLHGEAPTTNTSVQFTDMTTSFIARWCPWDLQLQPPQKPGDGVYPYPDDNIPRPSFDPCLSACAKSNAPADCCTGAYDDPKVCKPGLYSKNAKAVCPDAYSFAYDDQSSTFTIPQGGGFEIIFCPSGRSTNIIASTPTNQSLAQMDTRGEGNRRLIGKAWLGLALFWLFAV